jgi:hypothetical protein
MRWSVIVNHRHRDFDHMSQEEEEEEEEEEEGRRGRWWGGNLTENHKLCEPLAFVDEG